MPHPLSLTLVASLGLAACATSTAMPLSARLVVAPSRDLVVANVRAERDWGIVTVRGNVGRRGLACGPVWGHLHVEALSAALVVAWADTRWSQLAPRHRLPTSYFSVELPPATASIDEIRVSHASEGHRDARRSGISQ